MHPSSLPLDVLARDCEVTRTRRGGPGGQHRNKVETAIVIVHRPSDTRAEAGEERSQSQNLAQAWQRLRVNLALSVRSAVDDSPSSLWQTRVPNGKLSVNPAHEDYPALLAEALDTLAVLDWEVATTTERLQITSSQFIKFLKLDARALALVNNVRTARAQKPYR